MCLKKTWFEAEFYSTFSLSIKHQVVYLWEEDKNCPF